MASALEAYGASKGLYLWSEEGLYGRSRFRSCRFPHYILYVQYIYLYRSRQTDRFFPSPVMLGPRDLSQWLPLKWQRKSRLCGHRNLGIGRPPDGLNRRFLFLILLRSFDSTSGQLIRTTLIVYLNSIRWDSALISLPSWSCYKLATFKNLAVGRMETFRGSLS
jgi:hypothetical protein